MYILCILLVVGACGCKIEYNEMTTTFDLNYGSSIDIHFEDEVPYTISRIWNNYNCDDTVLKFKLLNGNKGLPLSLTLGISINTTTDNSIFSIPIKCYRMTPDNYLVVKALQLGEIIEDNVWKYEVTVQRDYIICNWVGHVIALVAVCILGLVFCILMVYAASLIIMPTLDVPANNTPINGPNNAHANDDVQIVLDKK